MSFRNAPGLTVVWRCLGEEPARKRALKAVHQDTHVLPNFQRNTKMLTLVWTNLEIEINEKFPFLFSLAVFIKYFLCIKHS